MKVPDYECWQNRRVDRPASGKEVDVCVIPTYGPRYDSTNMFHWNYRAAYRHLGGSAWPSYFDPDGGLLCRGLSA